MTKVEIEKAIAQHARNVNGSRHRFRVAWTALEPRWSRARRLLSIDVCPDRPTTGLLATVQVLTPVRTTREQLLRLLDDALDEFLREHGFDPSTAADPSEILA
jgi:hypothetical protein